MKKNRRAALSAVLALCSCTGTAQLRGGILISGNPAVTETDVAQLSSQLSQVRVFINLGNYDKSILLCKEIIRLDASVLEAHELLVQSSYELDRGNPARPELSRAVLFYRKLLQADSNNARLHYGLGLALKYSGSYEDSKSHFEACLGLGPDFWAVFEELIPCYLEKADLDGAVELMERAMAKYPANAFLRQGLGYVHFWVDEYSPALFYFERALEMFKEQGRRREEAGCLHSLAYLYMYLNSNDKAMEAIKLALSLARELECRSLEAEALELLSFIQTESGNYAKAHGLCREALSISEGLANLKLQMLCSRTLGVIHMEMGDLSQAQDCLEKSLRFYEDAGETQKFGIALYWMTLVHQNKGDFSRALASAARGLEIAQRTGFKTGEAFHLSSLGKIYISLGQPEKSLSYNHRALQITEKYIGKWSREECYNAIGYVCLDLGQHEKALQYFQSGLDYVLQISHRREEARCLYNLGVARLKMGEEEAALRLFRASLLCADRNGNRAVMGLTYCRIGDIYLRKKVQQTGKKMYEEALRIGEDIGHPGIVGEAYTGLGSVAETMGNPEQAVTQFKKSIAVIEDLRSRIMINENSAGFFRTRIGTYEQLVNLLFELDQAFPGKGYDRECFYFAEKAKARAFLDDLQEAKIDFSAFPIPDEKKKLIDGLSKRVSHILTQLSSFPLGQDERSRLGNELEQAEDELQEVMEAVKRDRPDYAEIVDPEPLRCEEIQADLMDAKTGLIKYFVGDKHIFVFFCSARGLLIRRLSTELSEQVIRLTKNYIGLVSSRHFNGDECRVAGAKLYDQLVAPAASFFGPDTNKLVIFPDRELHYLPFETLVNRRPRPGFGGKARYLMEEYGISYAPSVSSLYNILKRTKGLERKSDLLAVGDPAYSLPLSERRESLDSGEIVQAYDLGSGFHIFPLHYASKEIRSISTLFRKSARRVVSGSEATEEIIKNLPLSDYRIIHFATHSLVDETNANRSSLVLSLDRDPAEDGFYQAREIYNTRMRADLVVLSACQTARGKYEKGEGIQGLARAFFAAGAQSVLASLWNIDDKSTAFFMKLFYGYLARGKTKLEALNLAKIRMVHSRYSNPYYWAGFVLIGEADARINIQASNWLERLFPAL
jgi:CHAT domain-containing protein/Tfp pilus assembly protein PilF